MHSKHFILHSCATNAGDNLFTSSLKIAGDSEIILKEMLEELQNV